MAWWNPLPRLGRGWLLAVLCLGTLGLSGPRPATAAPTAAVPPAALTTLQAFLAARLARDEARARGFLPPTLNARLAYQDLLPVSSPQWTSTTVTQARWDQAGTVTAVVAIHASDRATGRQWTGTQTLTLTDQSGRWLVRALTPLQWVALSTPGLPSTGAGGEARPLAPGVVLLLGLGLLLPTGLGGWAMARRVGRGAGNVHQPRSIARPAPVRRR